MADLPDKATPPSPVNGECHDQIAALKQQIAELQDSNHLLQMQYLLSRSEYISLDMDFHILSYSEGATDLFKLLPEDLGKTVKHIVHTIKGFDLQALMQNCINEQKTLRQTVSDYSGESYLFSATPFLTHNFRIGGLILSFDKLQLPNIQNSKSIYLQQIKSDKTGQASPTPRCLTPSHSATEANTPDLFELSPTGYLVLRRDASIRQANSTMARMLGTTVSQLEGRSLMEFVDTKCREKLLRSLWRSWIDGYTENCEIRIRYGAISLDAICTILAVELTDQKYELRINVTDISAIKHREEREKTFFAIAGHELRTPLTNIQLALDMALKKSEQSKVESIESFLRIAHRASSRLQKLADSMFDYNAAVAGSMVVEKKKTELLSLIEDILQYNRLDPNIHTEFELIKPLQEIWVFSDPDRLYQVCVNLLRNAARHSPAGTAVVIRVERNGSWVRVNVIDRGDGVDESIKDDLFEPFVQAEHALEDEPNKHSHGLGLSISRSIIELLGGRIGYSRIDGLETCFYFDLPIANREPPE